MERLYEERKLYQGRKDDMKEGSYIKEERAI
jgi:hypothetical protein